MTFQVDKLVEMGMPTSLASWDLRFGPELVGRVELVVNAVAKQGLLLVCVLSGQSTSMGCDVVSPPLPLL